MDEIKKIIKRIRKPKSVKADNKSLPAGVSESAQFHDRPSLNIATGGQESHKGIIINTK